MENSSHAADGTPFWALTGSVAGGHGAHRVLGHGRAGWCVWVGDSEAWGGGTAMQPEGRSRCKELSGKPAPRGSDAGGGGRLLAQNGHCCGLR